MCSCLQPCADVWHCEGMCDTLQIDVSAILTVRMHHTCIFGAGAGAVAAAAACACVR